MKHSISQADLKTFCKEPLPTKEHVKPFQEQTSRLPSKMEAFGMLAGGIAHDFNNIIQIIINYSHILISHKEENHPDLFYLKKIHNASNRASELVSRLLAFNIQLDFKQERINLNTTIKDILDLFATVIPDRVIIEARLQEDIPEAFLDRVQMGQVIMNLVCNSLDAVSGIGRILIETHYLPDGIKGNEASVPHLLLRVSDDGCGMSKEVQDQIFEPFFSTKDEGENAGLGLSTILGIVKEHKGIISCKSKPGKGTAFEILLPYVNHDKDDFILDSDEGNRMIYASSDASLKLRYTKSIETTM